MDNPKTIEVQIVNAFTDNNTGGNPAGIVLAADALSQQEKLAIAAKVGLSETAFVSSSATAAIKLEFFTPNRQIAHCGHATIATFTYLQQLNQIQGQTSSKETIDGRREIILRDSMAFMEQKAPVYQQVPHLQKRILASLSLKQSDLLADAPIQVISTGNSFAIIPVKDAKTLAAIRPSFDLITQMSNELDLIGFYVFTTDTHDPDRDADARMFAPRYDIKEEAATGMAAGPLACYLHDVLKNDKQQLLIRQGKYMEEPSPSLIVVDLIIENGTITGLMAGGEGVFAKKLSLII